MVIDQNEPLFYWFKNVELRNNLSTVLLTENKT